MIIRIHKEAAKQSKPPFMNHELRETQSWVQKVPVFSLSMSETSTLFARAMLPRSAPGATIC